jgi:uncharacterized protein (DUF169 family)
MTNEQIEKTIKDNVPGISKEFVAMKMWKEEPKDVPKYEGRAFPGICAQIGEVLWSKETFYLTGDQNFCEAGIQGAGLKALSTEEEWKKTFEEHAKMSRGIKDLETAHRYYQVGEGNLCGVPERNAAVQLGLFKDVKDPDVVLIFCPAAAGDIINRAYAYETGEILKGFGSFGACSFTIRYPYVRNEPTLTIGDVEWRTCIGLDPGEITLAFPYQTFFQFIDSLPKVAQHYKNLAALQTSLRQKTAKTPPTMEDVAKFVQL